MAGVRVGEVRFEVEEFTYLGMLVEGKGNKEWSGGGNEIDRMIKEVWKKERISK